MVFFLVVGILSALVGLFYVVLAIRSKNPKNLVSVSAEVIRKKGYKNFKLRSRSVPNATEYICSYTVNGKTYRIRGLKHTHTRNIPKRITVIYLRGFPQCAYEEKFYGTAQWVFAFFWALMGVVCISVTFLIT